MARGLLFVSMAAPLLWAVAMPFDCFAQVQDNSPTPPDQALTAAANKSWAASLNAPGVDNSGTREAGEDIVQPELKPGMYIGSLPGHVRRNPVVSSLGPIQGGDQNLVPRTGPVHPPEHPVHVLMPGFDPRIVAEASALYPQGTQAWREFIIRAQTGLMQATNAQDLRGVGPFDPSMSIPLQADGGTYTMPALINDTITLNFTVDSGAADVIIPADVVLTLIRAGTLDTSDFIGSADYVLADGSIMPSKKFRIRSLKVGDLTVENVSGSIAPARGPLLLGQSFLSRFKSWSIDNVRQVLVLIEK